MAIKPTKAIPYLALFSPVTAVCLDVGFTEKIPDHPKFLNFHFAGTSTNSEVELGKATSNENRMQNKACPQEQQPEEEIPKVPPGPGPYFYISGSNGAGL